MSIDKPADDARKPDYSFIDVKAKADSSLLSERKTLITQQETQIKRLDKVGRIESEGTFLGMPGLSFFFDQFASEMLSKASKASNLLEL